MKLYHRFGSAPLVMTALAVLVTVTGAGVKFGG